MTWNNQDLAIYHGTNTHAFGATPVLYETLKFSLDWRKCRANTDFGLGFYATTSLHQATQWANNSVRNLAAKRNAISSKAIVLRFDLDRDELSKLETLNFVRDTDDFYNFVAFCRAGGRPHRRADPRRKYDVVFGPVALRMQKHVIQDSDQISFHSQEAAESLCRKDATVYDIAAAATGLLP